MALTQYYIVEVQQYNDGSFGHIVHFAYDEDPERARNKADAKYYQVLSAAAESNLPCHSVILFSSECFPLLDGRYHHTPTPEPEPEPEPEVVEGE